MTSIHLKRVFDFISLFFVFHDFGKRWNVIKVLFEAAV